MSLAPPEKVQKLQTALHAKAKGSPDYRFYALYDKVYRKDVLLHAFACCKANKGAAGVDGQEGQEGREPKPGDARRRGWSRAGTCRRRNCTGC